jgi:hypothetical protein
MRLYTAHGRNNIEHQPNEPPFNPFWISFTKEHNLREWLKHCNRNNDALCKYQDTYWFIISCQEART